MPTLPCKGAFEKLIAKSSLNIALLVELAWCWLRYQSQSRLARWYRERFSDRGARSGKVGIVALARKLAIALWHYVEDGIIPDGAKLKAM